MTGTRHPTHRPVGVSCVGPCPPAAPAQLKSSGRLSEREGRPHSHRVPRRRVCPSRSRGSTLPHGWGVLIPGRKRRQVPRRGRGSVLEAGPGRSEIAGPQHGALSQSLWARSPPPGSPPRGVVDLVGHRGCLGRLTWVPWTLTLGTMACKFSLGLQPQGQHFGVLDLSLHCPAV